MNKTDMLKDLRAATQAGMKDCKEALEEANWDFQKAVDLVKVRGLNVVSGREGRVASEGVVAIAPVGFRGWAMVEVNCQTDFVANSPDFRKFAQEVANKVAACTEDNTPFTVDQVEQSRADVVSKTKENVVVRRWWVEEAMQTTSMVVNYVHSNNKIGVLLTVLASNEEVLSNPELVALAGDLAMQVAAMNPVAVSSDSLSAEVVERQKNIFTTQLTEMKKPQAAWAKILEGKFNKWYTEVCLLSQESVVFPKTTVQQVLNKAKDSLGSEMIVVNFIRCQVGDGIEKVAREDLQLAVAEAMNQKQTGDVIK